MAASPSHRTHTHAGHPEPITVLSSRTAAARYLKCTISTRFDRPLTDSQCPLLEVKRTWFPHRKMSANDPKRKSIFFWAAASSAAPNETIIPLRWATRLRRPETALLQSNYASHADAQLPLLHDKEARHRPQRVKRA